MTVLDYVPQIDSEIVLPVSRLSASSLNLYSRCPTAWKRRYIDHIPDTRNAKMLVGSAAGAALAQYYGHRIDGGSLGVQETLDEYSDEFESGAADEAEPVDFAGEERGKIKDRSAAALGMYLRTIAPSIIPAAVEREVSLSWPGIDWHVTGFIDLETVDGAVVDFKNTGQKWSDAKALEDIQPDIYLAARAAEANPAERFDYHLLVRTATPTAYVLNAPRSEQRLAALTRRVMTVARSIQWRYDNDVWEGAGPDIAWLCRGCSATDCDWRRA